MRKSGIAGLSCCALFAMLVVAAPRLRAAAAESGLPTPYFTRQPSFIIPFIPPTAAAGEQEVVEVRLLVSTDYGATWTPIDRVEPRKASFTYRPPHDGEYWFAFQAADRQGRIRPEKPTSPAVRVVVDTLPPRLELKAARTGVGEIEAHWLAVDPLLKADTLTIEYQVAGDAAWRSVEFEPPRDDPGRSTAVGDVTWRPTAPGATTVRATIRDRAGNVAVAQAIVGEGQPASEGPSLEPPARLAPTSAPLPASPSHARPTEERHDRTTRQEPTRRSTDSPPAQSPPETAIANAPGSAAWPTDHVSDRPLGDGPSPALPTDRAVNRGPFMAAGNATFAQSPAPVSGGPTESRVNSAVTERVGPLAAQPDFVRGLPAGERPYMVNSRNFALEYEVESVGPSGVAKVEIWGTRDGGRTWQSFGIKPREQGPVKVSVPDEGLYGFRITVQDGTGLSSKPPANGDLPELWVGVDLTKPFAKLTGIELGTGDHAGELLIRWEASDAMLAARPVTLLFSERPEGSWSTIAAGLDNTGAYAWRFDNRVPDRIFVRLDVRDEAGNVGQFQTAEPISLAPNRPEGHLRSVRPSDDAASRPTRQFWR